MRFLRTPGFTFAARARNDSPASTDGIYTTDIESERNAFDHTQTRIM